MKKGNGQYHIKQEELLSEIEIQERSLKSYEKAVYDNIGQILSLAKMQLFMVDLEGMDNAQIKINKSRSLIGKAIRDLRQVTKQLSCGDIIDKGVAFAIEHELQRIKNSKICETEFRLVGSPFKLDKGKNLMLFSILQTIVYDILLFQVSKFIIKMIYSLDEIEVKIIYQNNGPVFLTNDLIKANIKLSKRLKMIGAGLIIENLNGSGKIFITIKK